MQGFVKADLALSLVPSKQNAEWVITHSALAN
jgi:hypothetical protein